jgi:hypothetical protein
MGLLTAVPPHQSRWDVQGASVAGARHLSDGAPCEDAFAHARLAHEEGEVLVLVVADGAGSAARAAEGAQIMSGTVVQVCRRLLSDRLPETGDRWRGALALIAGEAIERYQRATDELDERGTRAFASTLLVAVSSGPWIALLSIGDCFAIVRRVDGGLHLPQKPRHPDGLVTSTTFVSAHDAIRRADVCVIQDAGVSALALATDGLAPAALTASETQLAPHRPFVEPLLAQADRASGSAQLRTYLGENDTLVDTTDDDRTLLMAVRR